jgi:N-acetylglucosaminyldiphosphoundecaprenol N-acetyl-beta-D-mannosaminyltransferase
MTGEHRNIVSMSACGVRYEVLSLESAVDLVISGAPGRAVHLCNAYTLGLASRDVDYSRLLCRGDLNLPDGMPLVWMARRSGVQGAERVYGPDVMAGCLDRGRAREVRHFLYGSTPEVIRSLVGNIGERWPGARIVGVESPPFGDLSTADLDEAHARMAASDADVVWVGLGTPRQDHVVAELAGRGGATFVAVGAAFDFIAGTKPMAPRWMQRSGLEWMFRLVSEPGRLWRRYLVGIPVFIVGCLRQRPHVVADVQSRPDESATLDG